jgi:acyl-CoA dehydrogenase
MSDELTNSAERLFADLADPRVLRDAEAGIWPGALWDATVSAGFTAALLPEEAGGFGVTALEAMGLVRVAASHAAPIPLGESMLAARLLAYAGLVVPEGPLTLAPVRANEAFELSRAPGGWRLVGTASRIPWARWVTAVVIVARTQEEPKAPRVVRLPAGSFKVATASNLAGEPRDTIIVDAMLAEGDLAPVDWGPDQLHAAGAVLRCNQIAGAIGRALALTVDYAQTRAQFGRPIGKFQAIQQNLAVFAGQSVAATAAAEMAGEALENGFDPLVVGAAKARAGEAASIAAAIAHQTHGAIGFTQEYALHHLTRRLWSWRDEFGNEAEWQRVIGRAAFAAGADGLWPMITAAA